MVIKQLGFWKIIFGCSLAVAIALTFRADFLSESTGLEYSPSVRAAVFAVCAALMLFLAHVPNSFGELRGGRLLDALFSAIGAVAAVATGWFWLEDETPQNPFSFIAYPVGVGALLFSGVVVSAVIGDIQDWRQKRKQQDE